MDKQRLIIQEGHSPQMHQVVLKTIGEMDNPIGHVMYELEQFQQKMPDFKSCNMALFVSS